MNKEYRVHAKRIMNNPAGESSLVGRYEGYNKHSAIYKAMNDPANRGIYRVDSFWAICVMWEFEEAKQGETK